VSVHNVAGLWLTGCPGIAAYTHVSDPRQAQPPMLHPLARQQAPAIRMRGVIPPLEALARLAARIPRSISAAFETTEERLQGPFHTLQRVLSCLSWEGGGCFAAQRGHIMALLGMAHGSPLPLPGSTPLLQRRVVQQAMRLTLRLKRGFLRWCGIEAIGGTTVDSFHAINSKLVMETKQPLRTLHHCVYNLNFHLVLVTKYRRKCLTSAMREHLVGTLTGLLKKWGGTLLECHGEADHMHLLIALPPTVLLSTFVNNLKTVSSRLLRKEYGPALARWYRQPVLWSRSYCVLSCGGAPLSVLRQYIEQQGNGAS
jgi:putative transposase